MDEIKAAILVKFEKALTMELPLKDIIGMGNVIALFEQNALNAEKAGVSVEAEKLV